MKTENKFKVGDWVFLRIAIKGIVVGRIAKIVNGDYPYKICLDSKIVSVLYSREFSEIQKLTDSELAWYLVTNEN